MVRVALSQRVEGSGLRAWPAETFRTPSKPFRGPHSARRAPRRPDMLGLGTDASHMHNRFHYYENRGPRFVLQRPGITRAVQRLILLNVVVFAAQLIANIPFGAPTDSGLPVGVQLPGGEAAGFLAFSPLLFLRGALWTPFTYMVLHGGLMHLFQNMLFLFFFGPEVERVLSTRQFYRFFVFCGALGVFATFITAILQGDFHPVVGASGAIMGVLAAFAIINPEREIFLFPLPIPINARFLVIIVIFYNIFFGAMGRGSGVSWETHLGGLAAGYLYMRFLPKLRWRWRKPKPRDVGDEVDRIFEIPKHRDRRH